MAAAASAMICGLRDEASKTSPLARFDTADVAMYVCGHRQLNPIPASAFSEAQPSESSVIPYLESV